MPSPRVTYWTGIWDPTREALSREVDTLRRLDGPPRPVVSFSPGQRSSFTRTNGVIRLSGRRWLLLRALAAAVEPFGDITHVLGPINSWHLLRAVGRRPVVFTTASPGPPLDASMYGRVRMFAAETEPLAAALRAAGVRADRVRVIYPGVDLSRFAPAPPPSGRFRVVFASSPASVADFDARGIPLMVEAARLCPEIDLVLLWRRWGSRSDAERALAALRPPGNVLVDHRDVDDIAAVFRQAHATIWMASPGYGKSCPNSVMEGLACGRPGIVSASCGIADVIRENGAGLTPDRDPRAMAAALRRLQMEPEAWRARARAVAERFFSLEGFCRSYRTLYEAALERPSPTAALAG